MPQTTAAPAPQAAPGSLLGIEHLSPDVITGYLDLGKRMDPSQPSTLLAGKRVALLFYEASTRTRVSFELAAKALGATTTIITATASSIEKGESLIDTAYTLVALGADCIVMRHPMSGAPNLMARHLPKIPVINAGDGMHEHPSQAILDAFTMLRHKKTLKGLKVTIMGDVYHSRVARSNVFLLTKMGADVTLCGPPELVPDVATTLADGVRVSRKLSDGISGVDVVMLLRIQKERFVNRRLSYEQYVAEYQMTPERLSAARPDAILMHPGPMIRGVEISATMADHPRSVILEQVHNGLITRMGVLARAYGKA